MRSINRTLTARTGRRTQIVALCLPVTVALLATPASDASPRLAVDGTAKERAVLTRAYARGTARARSYTDRMLGTVNVTVASKIGENGNSLYEVATSSRANSTRIFINRRLVTSSTAVAPHLWSGLGFGVWAHAFAETPEDELARLVRQSAIDKKAKGCSFADGLSGRFPCGPMNYVFAPGFSDYALRGQSYEGRDLPRYWISERRMDRFLRRHFVFPTPECTEKQSADTACP